MKDLSILVVTYQSADYIEACLQSIIQHSGNLSVEIVVVDNRSSDKTVQIIKNRFPSAILIENDENVGFAVAMNQAYRASSGKYVMTFNPDAEVYEDTLSNIILYLDTHENVGGLGGITWENGLWYFPEHSLPWIAIPQTWKIIRNKWVKKEAQALLVEKEVNWIWGTGITVRKSLLTENQMFEEFSFLFWEEYDLALAIRKSSKMIINPTVRFTHHSSTSFKFNPQKLTMARQLSIGIGYGIRKRHFGLFAAKISHVVSCMDFGFLSLWFGIKMRWHRSDALLLEYANYKANLLGHWKVLVWGQQFTQMINLEAKQFFNRR